MATALRTQDEGFAAQTLPPSAAAHNDQAPVRPEWRGAPPERLVVREISFLMDSDGLQFLYKDSAAAEPLPADGIGEVAASAAAAPLPPLIGLSGAGLATAETPLDLSLTGAPAFLVFKLDTRLNWRFSRTEPAITHKQAAHAAFYGGLMHVDRLGNVSAAPVDDCRVAFLVARPPAGPYRHGFNFNVELIQKPHVGDSEPRVLPIMIDPDIRFPGGSTT
ncbi:MAG TPA: nucleotide synthetase [Allosphingosinicella sp.]|jgi:hypothetical protein